ncbi:nuclear transport factor 2 family protein [Pasteurellaceae bacterium LIM206]|nr:nuclear transport factor 2 family protein [Pasteurellaceae bacterium LIM206]
MISQTTQDYRAIEKVIKDYVDGANGDVPLLKSVFLPTALINGRPIQGLYNAVEARGKTEATYRISFIDIVGTAASIKIVVENWHGYHFVEFFHALKTTDGWKFSSKIGVEFDEE